jgi:hypothetical protein
MISIALMIALALGAAPSPGPSQQARKAYSVCLQKMIKDKTEAKLSADAFTAAVKSSCASQEAALKQSLIAYDVATGVKRADAEEGANLQIEDYLVNAADTYATYTNPQ